MQRKDKNHGELFYSPGYIKALSPAWKETVDLGSISFPKHLMERDRWGAQNVSSQPHSRVLAP